MGPLLSTMVKLSFTAIATADIKALQLVGFNGAPTGAGDAVYGVAATDAKAGDEFTVNIITIQDFIAPAAISKGSAVQSNADGAPVVEAGGATFGVALTAADNPGDLVSILVK